MVNYLGLPIEASAHAADIDQMIALTHWLMLVRISSNSHFPSPVWPMKMIIDLTRPSAFCSQPSCSP